MKKLILFISVCFLISCSDNEEFKHSSIIINEFDNVFAVDGGQTEVFVNAGGRAVSIDYSCDWIDVTINNNVVFIDVHENTNLKSRDADIKIFAGKDKKTISIQQAGLGIIVTGYEYQIDYKGGDITIPFDGVDSPSFSSENAWLKAELKNGNIVINATKNKSFDDRVGTVNIYSKAGNTTIPVIVTQTGLANYEAMAGSWIFESTSNTGTAQDNRAVSFISNNNGLDYTVKGLEYDFNITYTQNNCLYIWGRQHVGFEVYNGINAYVFLMISSSGHSGSNSSSYYSVSIYAEPELTNDYLIYRFKDTDQWSGTVADGFWFRLYSTNDPSSSSTLGRVVGLYNSDIVLSKKI